MSKFATIPIIEYQVIDWTAMRHIPFDDSEEAEEYFDSLRKKNPSHEILFAAIIKD